MELLVVVAIIALLVAILIPAMGAFRRASKKAAITTYMGAIQTGINGYGMDNRGGIPPSRVTNASESYFGLTGLGGTGLTTWNGGELLAAALVGPAPKSASPVGDGKDGYGFTDSGGKNYGPYINIKNDYNIRARWSKNGTGTQTDTEYFTSPDVTGTSQALSSQPGAFILTMQFSAAGMPILYYAADATGQTGSFLNTAGNPTISTSWIWGPQGRFNIAHNQGLYVNTGNRVDPSAYWQRTQAGDGPPMPTAEDAQKFAIQLRQADYLLVSPGPDDLFGAPGDASMSMTQDVNQEVDDIPVTGNAIPR